MKGKGNGPAFILQTYEDRLNNNNNDCKNKDSSQKLTEPLSDLQGTLSAETKRLTPCEANGVGTTPPPPPPPPQINGSLSSSTLSTPPSAPSTRSNTLKGIKTKPKAPPVPVKYSVLSYNQSPNNDIQKAMNGFNTSSIAQQPPPCPTPDYDTLSLASTTSSSVVAPKPSASQNRINESVEMESLESFRINNPKNIKPKPPSTYFQKRNLTNSLSNQSSSSTTSTVRRSRPISVTIGEYPSMRRQPGKLDFLQQNGQDVGGSAIENLGSRLTSELTQTLNRSNLKKRTESMENLLGDASSPTTIKTQRNGAVRISLSNLSKAFTKSTSDLTEDFHDQYDILPIKNNVRNNRVTINVNLRKPETPSGILKNGSIDCETSHKTLTAQKSITFGEMPTLIKDKSPTKS